MAEKPSWIVLKSSERDAVPLIWTPGWQIVPAQALPNIFPKSLRLKVDSAYQIVEPTSTGGMHLAWSLNRIDGDKVDVEPFGLALHSTGPSPEAVYIHHGQWDGRTTTLPAGFAPHVMNVGTGSYFVSYPPHGLLAGTLDQLPKEHRGAWEAVVKRLRLAAKGISRLII